MKHSNKHVQNLYRNLCKTTLTLAGLVSSTASHACPAEAYTGQICTTAATFCPAGDGNDYLQPAGQQLSVNEYQMLFAVIGFTYGGNGSTNFNLPDLRGRSTVGTGQGAGLQNVTLGQKRGNESITLTQAQMPTHSHTATYNPTGGGATVTVAIPVSSNTVANTQTTPDATHNYLAGSPNSGIQAAAIWSSTMSQATTIQGVTGTVTGSTGTVSVGVAGGSTAFSALPPQMGMTYCIATRGLYPIKPN